MINKVELIDENRFYELGMLLNDKFNILYELDKILLSSYDNVYGYYLDNLVGFIHITKMYENIDIVNIVVDFNYRRKGIASELIRYVINLYDDVDSVMLEVNENNINAISLYKKLGFKEINIRSNYYGNDSAIIMKRDV